MDLDKLEKINTTQASFGSPSSTAFGGAVIQAQFDYLKGEIDKYESRIEKIKDGLDKKIDDSKIRVIETLGIFVALFTFVSIDFQVFKSYKDPLTISGLILILLGSLSMFIVLLDYLVINSDHGNKIKKELRVELVLISISCLVMGFFLLITGKK